MLVKLACICRGNAKVYALFDCDGNDSDSEIVASCFLSGGEPVPSQTVRILSGDNHESIVVVFPLSTHAITLILEHRNSSKTGKSEAIYRRRFTAFYVKWASRFNYRFRTHLASQIRDCEKDRSLTRDEIDVVGIIPMAGSTIYRCSATMPNGQEDSYQINVLDDRFRNTEIIPIEMGISETPRDFRSPVDKTSIQFSIKLPGSGVGYNIILYRNDSISAFETISEPRRHLLEKSYEKRIQNASTNPEYSDWLKENKARNADLIAQKLIEFDYSPLISLILNPGNTSLDHLKETFESVNSQSYSRWQLIVPTCTQKDGTAAEKALSTFKADSRIKVLEAESSRNVSQAVKHAIEESKGGFIAFLSGGDVLAPDALYEYVFALNQDPRIDIFYSDSDEIDARGRHFNPYYKPDYSEFLMRETNYMRHFNMVRSNLLKGTSLEEVTSNDALSYDILLKCLEQSANVHHCSRILYSSRKRSGKKTSTVNAESKLVLERHLARLGIDADVSDNGESSVFCTKYTVAGYPKVSIIIPSKDNKNILARCVRSIIDKSTYSNFEIIIVENNSEEPGTFGIYEVLQEMDRRVQILVWNAEFNYSGINNYGAEHATGDYLLFLNNDTEIISADWIENLLGVCQQEGVGAVGAKLLYADDTIQHGGIIVQASSCDHINSNLPQDAKGYFNTALTTREVSAVTAACLMCPMPVFQEVGGFDPEFAVAYNDVDFCLKVERAGYRVIFNAHCLLRHYESLTRGRDNTMKAVLRDRKELSLLAYKWSDRYVSNDPYSNANLDTWSTYFNLPKRSKG